MTPSVPFDAPEPGRSGASSPAIAARSIEGDLECVSAFELLQVLHYLGKAGLISLSGRSGTSARCEVRSVGLIGAECGALRDREAVLAFAWWKEGTFRFEIAPPGRPGEAGEATAEILQVQEVLLDAVRLADEIEARAGLVPDRASVLGVMHRDPLPSDLRELAAAPEILGTIRSGGELRREDLERSLPYAPVTIGFALARLCEEGYVGARVEVAEIPSPAERKRVDGERTGLVRILVAFDRDAGADVGRVVNAIHEVLGAPEWTGTLDSTTASFLRTRLSAELFLSITVLPISRRNRFVLESLLASLDLAVLLVARPDAAEVREWLKLGPEKLKVLPAEKRPLSPSELQSMLESLVRGRCT